MPRRELRVKLATWQENNWSRLSNFTPRYGTAQSERVLEPLASVDGTVGSDLAVHCEEFSLRYWNNQVREAVRIEMCVVVAIMHVAGAMRRRDRQLR
jgi:hypothetical protein